MKVRTSGPEIRMRVKKVRVFCTVIVLAFAAQGAVKVVTGRALLADSLSCDLSQYKSSPGLTAAIDQRFLAAVKACARRSDSLTKIS